MLPTLLCSQSFCGLPPPAICTVIQNGSVGGPRCRPGDTFWKDFLGSKPNLAKLEFFSEGEMHFALTVNQSQVSAIAEVNIVCHGDGRDAVRQRSVVVHEHKYFCLY